MHSSRFEPSDLILHSPPVHEIRKSRRRLDPHQPHEKSSRPQGGDHSTLLVSHFLACGPESAASASPPHTAIARAREKQQNCFAPMGSMNGYHIPHIAWWDFREDQTASARALIPVVTIPCPSSALSIPVHRSQQQDMLNPMDDCKLIGE